jgi:hypothetical protein
VATALVLPGSYLAASAECKLNMPEQVGQGCSACCHTCAPASSVCPSTLPLLLPSGQCCCAHDQVLPPAHQQAQPAHPLTQTCQQPERHSTAKHSMQSQTTLVLNCASCSTCALLASMQLPFLQTALPVTR